MTDRDTNYDEQQRRILQEYIFSLEEASDKAEDLAIANEQLKKSQDLLMAVLSTTSHGICLVRNDTFVWCNRAFTDILGRRREELIGTTTSLIRFETERYREVPYEHDFIHKNGRLVPCLTNSRPIDEKDPTMGYVLSITDLTGLKNTEIALKAAYQRLQERTGQLIRTNEDLNREIEEHKETEKKLNRYRDRLEEMVRDRTEAWSRANEKLRVTMGQMRALSHRLLEVQEIERRHIARELHDEIGQNLTALRIGLKRVGQSVITQSDLEIMDENLKIVDGLIKQIRNLSIELLPSILDDFGLTAALEWYVKRLSERAEINGIFRSELGEERLAPVIEVTCFRIAQEALTNVIRHSRARNVHIDLAVNDGEIHLSIKDDGTGFDVEAMRGSSLKGRSFGLLGMEERASFAGGRLEFESQTGKGTEVHAYFSCNLLSESKGGAVGRSKG